MKRAYLVTVLDLSLPPLTAEATRALGRGLREAMQLLKAAPTRRMELALSGAATEQLLGYGEQRALQMVAERASAGQLSFLSTACFGAFLPLVGPHEGRRQMELTEEANRRALGNFVYCTEGLFPPQLGYSRAVAELAIERGLSRVLADSLAYHGGHTPLPRDRHFVLHGHRGFQVFFVDRQLSELLAGGGLRTAAELCDRVAPGRAPGYAVVRVPSRLLAPGSAALESLASLDRSDSVVPAGLEEILALFGELEEVEPLPTALGTDPGELAEGIPFAKWSAPDNQLQAILWRLATLASSEARRLARTGMEHSAEAGRLRARLDQSLDSAAWRFASGRPELDVARVLAGAERLVEALRAGRPLVDEHAMEEALELLELLRRRCAQVAQALPASARPEAGPAPAP